MNSNSRSLQFVDCRSYQSMLITVIKSGHTFERSAVVRAVECCRLEHSKETKHCRTGGKAQMMHNTW